MAEYDRLRNEGQHPAASMRSVAPLVTAAGGRTGRHSEPGTEPFKGTAGIVGVLG